MCINLLQVIKKFWLNQLNAYLCSNMNHNYLLTQVASQDYSALNGQVSRIPVWVMRQAGRILPEYRALRERLKDFKELVKTPQLAAEVTLQPVEILGVDAAIIFSDILVIPEAMGLNYEMIEQRGPYFPKTIQNKADIDALKIAEASDLQYVLDAIALTKKELNKNHPNIPLIGFAGAPWTIFCYMLEGKGSKTFSIAKKMLYTEPLLAHQLLQKITDSTIAYLQAQIKAGADLVQLFDSWAEALSPETYAEFSLPYLKQISEAMVQVPVTIFAKGALSSLEAIGKLPCAVIGLDWHMKAETAKKLIPANKTLQGNLDPCVLYASEEMIIKKTTDMLDSFQGRSYIANLGHGVYPDTDWKKVKLFVDVVKNYSIK